MQAPEAQMSHVSDLILILLRERPSSHSSQGSATSRPRSPPFGGGRTFLDSQFVRKAGRSLTNCSLLCPAQPGALPLHLPRVFRSSKSQRGCRLLERDSSNEHRGHLHFYRGRATCTLRVKTSQKAAHLQFTAQGWKNDHDTDRVDWLRKF